jgi:hypothetical protein
MARHRIHSLAFKKQVVQKYAAEATLNALAYNAPPGRTGMSRWSRQKKRAAEAALSGYR